MSIEYKWNIISLYVIPQYSGRAKVVDQIKWQLCGTLEGFSEYTEGTTAIPYTENSEFTPYELVTQDQVCLWLENALTTSIVNEIKSYIENKLNAKLKPSSTEFSVPWA